LLYEIRDFGTSVHKIYCLSRPSVWECRIACITGYLGIYFLILMGRHAILYIIPEGMTIGNEVRASIKGFYLIYELVGESAHMEGYNRCWATSELTRCPDITRADSRL
jgi:hypothetical protein